MLSGEAALHAHATDALKNQHGLHVVGGSDDWLRGRSVEHYYYGGYVMMMGCGGGVAFLSAVVTSFIKKAK